MYFTGASLQGILGKSRQEFFARKTASAKYNPNNCHEYDLFVKGTEVLSTFMQWTFNSREKDVKLRIAVKVLM